jgi:hypothetical protein
MIAKMLDIPAVLLRTDFRNGGQLFGDDWNLMAIGYPRCTIVKHPALTMYNDLGLEKMHRTIAQSIINAFDKVVKEKPLLSSYEEIFYAYQHVNEPTALRGLLKPPRTRRLRQPRSKLTGYLLDISP